MAGRQHLSTLQWPGTVNLGCVVVSILSLACRFCRLKASRGTNCPHPTMQCWFGQRCSLGGATVICSRRPEITGTFEALAAQHRQDSTFRELLERET